MFEYYVFVYDFNEKRIKKFNIFNNFEVSKSTEREIRKYLRSPNKYTNIKGINQATYGFEALCDRIDSIIKWQEWGRVQYEISISAPFEDFECSYFKTDCYEQVHLNIETLTRDLLWQYKHKKKEEENEKN